MADRAPEAPWMASETVRARMNVWSATGMLMAASQVSQPGGLALLRGYAFSHDLAIDDLTQQLTSQQLSVDRLLID